MKWNVSLNRKNSKNGWKWMKELDEKNQLMQQSKFQKWMHVDEKIGCVWMKN